MTGLINANTLHVHLILKCQIGILRFRILILLHQKQPTELCHKKKENPISKNLPQKWVHSLCFHCYSKMQLSKSLFTPDILTDPKSF
jgi:hypothetical protein